MLGCIALVAAGLSSSACVHQPAATARTSAKAHLQRKLLVLEGETNRFWSGTLSDAKPPSRAQTKAAIERETKALERLRMRYLDVLAEADDDRDRVLVMLRLAELHLDLGARIRRAEYPHDATDADRAAFDAFLSKKALPLEATAHGLIAQILDLGRRRGIEGELVERAELYARLHGPRSDQAGPLGPLWLPILEREWSKRGPFAAPRRLLEAGRIGQRAARR